MKRLINKLKSMFSAMAFAEAGDFDAVKQLLREESTKQKSEQDSGKRSSQQPVLPAM